MGYNTIAAQWWTNILRADNEQDKEREFKAFEERLAKEIYDKVEKTGNAVIAVTDLPDKFINEIAHATGLVGIGFPSNTIMWIERDRISIRIGFGKIQTIFTVKKDKNPY